MTVTYRHYRAGAFTSWEAMLADVAEFGSWAGPGALVAISQSEDKGSAVVTVWHRPEPDQTRARLGYRIFRGGAFTPWETVFNDAAAFASTLPPMSIASISQSEDKNDGLVVVWYWS